MIMSKILKPKWQHRKPEIRKEALIQMTSSDPDYSAAITSLALEEPDPEIRTLAIKRIGGNVELLEKVIKIERDEKVSQVANQQLLGLFTAKDSPLTLEQQKMLLSRIDTPSTIEQVSLKAADSELRKRALERVTRQTILEQIIVDDSNLEIRTAALDKIDDIQALERIIKKCRTKNKSITRLAKEKLQVKVDAIERPKEVERKAKTICASLETLNTQGYNDRLSFEIERLKSSWSEIEGEAPKEFINTYSDLSAQLSKLLEEHNKAEEERIENEKQHAELIKQKESLCEKVESKAASLDTLNPEAETNISDEIKNSLNDAQSEWKNLPSLPLIEEQSLEKRFKHACSRIDRLLISLKEYPVLLEQIDDLSKKSSDLLKSEAPLSSKRVNEIQKSISNFCLPSHIQKEPDSLSELKKKVETLQQRIDKQESQKNQAKKELPTLLEKVETDLEKGEFQHARNDLKKAKKLISKIPNQDHALMHRYHRLQNQLNELQDWQGFATTPKKESLCIEMESLVNSDIPPEEKAKQIHQLQEEWKSLGAADPKVSQKLWERFKKASEDAYAPCKAHYAKLAEERHTNLEKRQDIYNELELMFKQTDWENPDWKKVDKQFQALRNRWRDCGPTDRKPGKAVSEQYRDACSKIQDKLNGYRSENEETKKALIDKVTKAQELEDVFEAAEVAKKAQRSWKETGPTDRKTEQSLWKSFRSACDVIFDKRQEHFDSQNSERNDNLSLKNSICDKMNALISDESMEIARLRSEFKTLQDEWQSVGQVPQKSHKASKEKFDKCNKAFEKTLKQRRQQLENDKLNAVDEKRRLCEELEMKVLNNGKLSEEEMTAYQTKWDNFQAGPKDLDDAINQRFKGILTLNEKQDDSTTPLSDIISTNLSTKKELCLRIEILANIESPPEYTQERMQFQVARLEQGMKSAKVDPSNEFAKIEREWYRVGPIPVEDLAQLNERFETARQQFRQSS